MNKTHVRIIADTGQAHHSAPHNIPIGTICEVESNNTNDLRVIYEGNTIGLFDDEWEFCDPSAKPRKPKPQKDPVPYSEVLKIIAE